MPGDGRRDAFEFFLEHFKSGKPFTRKELNDRTPNWTGDTPNTHWGKWFRHFCAGAGSNQYRVTGWFRQFSTWEKFERYTSQARPKPAKYQPTPHNVVRIYEFFLPLTHEPELRFALDALFYQEDIRTRIPALPPTELAQHFPRAAGQSEDDYQKTILDFISDHFEGYSTYQVSGRFRLTPLKQRAEVGNAVASYLDDETTAVARFIFPCKDGDEAEKVDFLFTHLFVEAILETVTGEDAIWLVETGHTNRLRVWQVAKTEE